jgi:hypothetical protein
MYIRRLISLPRIYLRMYVLSSYKPLKWVQVMYLLSDAKRSRTIHQYTYVYSPLYRHAYVAVAHVAVLFPVETCLRTNPRVVPGQGLLLGTQTTTIVRIRVYVHYRPYPFTWSRNILDLFLVSTYIHVRTYPIGWSFRTFSDRVWTSIAAVWESDLGIHTYIHTTYIIRGCMILE